MKNFPPRMSAGQLLWWGVGLLVGSIILTQVLLHPDRGRVNIALPDGFLTLVYTLNSMAHQVGIGLIVVSFAVAALSRLPVEQDADR